MKILMIQILSTIGLSILCCMVKGQDIYPNLLGNVKEVRTTVSMTYVDTIVNEGGTVSTYKYDIYGKILETPNFTFTYDETQNLISRKSNGRVEEFFYNSKNQVIEVHVYNSDEKITSKINYEYNDQENTQLEITRSYPDTLRSREEEYNKYDEAGNLIIEERRLFLKGIELEGSCKKKTFKYDDKGNKIRENYFRTCDKLDRTEKFIYDDNKNLKEHSTYYPNGNSGGPSSIKEVMEYDDFNHLIETKIYRGLSPKLYQHQSTRYEYDINGNFTKKIFTTITFNDNAPVSIEKKKIYWIEQREIEYH